MRLTQLEYLCLSISLTTSYRWQIIWQDSLLSITFDRISSNTIVAYHRQTKSISKLSYIDSMRRLCKIGLDIVQQRALSRPFHQQLLRIVECRDQIQDDLKQMEDHLTDVTKCRSVREQLEFWNLYMHRSYILSELCRPTIGKQHNGGEHQEMALSLMSLCVESLIGTVEAFLGLQNTTQFASQSWAAVHRSLSSALLLGILGEAARSERVRSLVSKLAAVISEVLSGIDPSELSPPLTRSVAALHKLIVADDWDKNLSPFGNFYGFDDQTTQTVSESTTLVSSPYLLSDEQNSPHSVLNSIFWGSGLGIL